MLYHISKFIFLFRQRAYLISVKSENKEKKTRKCMKRRKGNYCITSEKFFLYIRFGSYVVNKYKYKKF